MLVAAAPPTSVGASAAAASSDPVAVSDFNGDGYEDLVVPAPNESVAVRRRSGAVTVLYGGADGPGTNGSVVLHQGTAGVPSANEDNDFWGRAVDTGDVNADGFADLIVTGEESVGEVAKAGSVTVLFGSPTGLSGAGSQLIHQGSAGVPSANEAFDGWGSAVAVGDVNGDTFADVVVGAPSESVGSVVKAGSVTVLFGSAAGLSGAGAQLWHQGRANVPSANETSDGWGAALAVGDVDGDGFGDVVVGAPTENVGAITEAGAVTVLFGSASGLSGTGSQLLHQGSANVPSANEPFDRWGASLAVGDVNNDAFLDVIVGAPGEDVGAIEDAGSVTVLYGSSQGVSGAGSQLLHQGLSSVPATGELSDGWGATLAVGDFNNDSVSDVAIGAPNEGVGEADQAGSITVLFGHTTGLGGAGAESLHQDTDGVPDSSEAHDRWGAVLVAGAFDNDPGEDLAVGAPGEGIGNNVNVGAVTVFSGSANGLNPLGVFLTPGQGGVAGAGEPHDGWGSGSTIDVGDRMPAMEAELLRLVNALRTNPTGQYARVKPMPGCIASPFYKLTMDGLHPEPSPALVLDNRVAETLALQWSQLRAGDFGLVHRPSLGDTTPDSQVELLNRLGITPRAWGENVAWWTGHGNEDPIAQAHAFFEIWRESDSSHYCNLMAPTFERVGFGVLWSPESGRYWATQNLYTTL